MSFSLEGAQKAGDAYSRSKVQELSQLQKRVEKGSKDEEKLKKACEDFETIFIQQLFSSMRKTIPKSDFLDGGQSEEIFTEMLDGERAKAFAERGGLGLGKILYDQLRRQVETEESQKELKQE